MILFTPRTYRSTGVQFAAHGVLLHRRDLAALSRVATRRTTKRQSGGTHPCSRQNDGFVVARAKAFAVTSCHSVTL